MVNNASYLSTYNETYAGMTSGNLSWNETYAYSKFVNGTINDTQMEENSGVVNILVSWLQSLFYTETEVDGIVSGINTTSNIQELINDTGVYSTYNATYAGMTSGNLSWNETRADELYLKSMDYTNVALINQTNTFAENATFEKYTKMGNLWICDYTLTSNITKSIEEGLC